MQWSTLSGLFHGIESVWLLTSLYIFPHLKWFTHPPPLHPPGQKAQRRGGWAVRQCRGRYCPTKLQTDTSWNGRVAWSASWQESPGKPCWNGLLVQMCNLTESSMQFFSHLMQIVPFHRTMCRDKQFAAYKPKMRIQEVGTVLHLGVCRGEITVWDVWECYNQAPRTPCVTWRPHLLHQQHTLSKLSWHVASFLFMEWSRYVLRWTSASTIITVDHTVCECLFSEYI